MAARVEEEDMELDEEEGAQGPEDVEEVDCCSHPLEARYNVPNKLCAGGDKCRIPQNSDYMGLIKPSRNGKDYCMECFAAEDRRIQKKLYMKKRNERDKFEKVLRCSRCQKLWHRCFSLYIEISNFKCEERMEKAGIEKVQKVLDAGKGQS
ncbi:hypothetical protein B9Z55_022879 [Caenorhabditis nigoni]|uniref:Uncharacterized protein n=1 Tax=Caenorhabditis nigoni TaxID=1611254 RepID=A0A2G5SMX2_9PELO|nr:hypothetical protein B9Z55_022879 [Caenorhabditis nigoni]